MAKMSSFELTATITSANVTTFDYGALPNQLNAKAVYLLPSIPAVSAANASATINFVDADNNTLWASVTNGFAEATSAASAVTFYIGGANGEHFHMVWNTRPSGAATGTEGADLTTLLKVWVENYTN